MAKKRKKAAKARKKVGRATRRTAPRTKTRKKTRVAPRRAPAKVASQLETVAVSKAVAVNLAVTRRLEAEGRPPTDPMGVMGTYYRYDFQTMSNLLYAIHQILAAGVPPYTFQYDVATFANAALGLTLSAFIAAINRNTAP